MFPRSSDNDFSTKKQVLELALLGSPEVRCDTRLLAFRTQKALALLVYLAVTSTPQPRMHLAALLWPDREEAQARATLRSTLRLVREAITDGTGSVPSGERLIRGGRDRLGRESLWLQEEDIRLDLQIVEQAATLTRQLSERRSTDSPDHLDSLRRQLETAARQCRGPFLAGFTLDDAPDFADWIEQQRAYWQGRVDRVLNALSALQRQQGAFDAAIQTAERWIKVNPLSEEAYRCLMESQAAAGDRAAALATYASYAEMLARVLGIEPAPETVALAERLRVAGPPAAPTSTTRQAQQRQRLRRPNKYYELETPLVGREDEFSTLVAAYERARQGSVQVVAIEGEAGIGKTRLVEEFLRWAADTRGAIVLSGRAFETGGRLPYQPLVEALRARLEGERAPEDLLEDVWLTELSRILPELRERYPDLPISASEGSEARGRLFEAVAQFGKALIRHYKPDAPGTPLVLFLDDLHWADTGTRDLLWFLCRRWSEDRCPVLVVLAVRLEEVSTSSELRDWLHSLDRAAQTTIVIPGLLDVTMMHELVRRLFGDTQQLQAIAHWFHTETDGQPLYFVQTLRALLERQLVIWEDGDTGEKGGGRLSAPTFEQETTRFQRLLPSSRRAVIQERLERLTPTTRKLLMAASVLGTRFQPAQAWELADLDELTGLDALEEAERHLVVRVLEGGEVCVFTHDRLREVAYTETGEARRRVLHRRAFEVLEHDKAPAAELAHHALKAGLVEPVFRYSVQAGVAAAAVFAVEDAIGHYEQARAWLQEHQRLQSELSAAEVERLYAHLGRAYANQNAWEKAQQAYEELLAYAQHQRQFTLVSLTLNRLAVLALQQSLDKSRVRALLEEARQMAQTSHDQKALAETEWNLAQITANMWDDPTSALPHGAQALALARASHDQELEARSLSLLGYIHIVGGDFEEAMHCIEASLALYALLGTEPTTSRELSLVHYLSGAPLTQSLTNRASEAWCWALLAFAQAHAGQVQPSMRSGRRALALSTESKNVWVQINSMRYLTYGLLDVGAYEEALGLMQDAMALARTLPPTLILQRFLYGLGNVYHALQQWEEARSTLEEAVAVAETLDLGRLRVVTLSQLCMNCAVAGQWGQAHTYALQAMAVRESLERAMILLDFSPQYETEALLRGGDESQARAALHRLGERLGPSPRFRIPYLQSLAVLAAWEGHREQAIGQLREAAGLAADLGLPAEQWQIQAALGTLYEAGGEPAQAHTAWASAARIIQELAEGIGDEALRARFLAGPQIHPVLQHAQGEASPVPQDQAEPSGC